MTEPRHWADQLQFSLFVNEASYDAGVASWTSMWACSMRDFDGNAAHEVWDDVVTDDDLLVHNTEYPLVQELVRQSVRMTYEEPRTKPNTLAGFLALSLGTTAATQDGVALAYRHAIAPSVSPLDLPSIAAQVAHMGSSQYLYTGIKADSFTLRNNGAYLAFTCPLIGSGRRVSAATAFAPAIDEHWLRWGDCHIYLKDVTGAPLAVAAIPLQGATNLGVGTVDLSTRVLRMEVNHPNTLWADGGYRPSTGQLRGSLLTPKRRTDAVLELQVDTAVEASELTQYLEQRQLALEWQCVGELIDPAGTFRFGMTVLIPRVQWRAIRRQEQQQFDTLVFEGRVLDDQVNLPIRAWVYNAQPGYLHNPAGGVPLVLLVSEPWTYASELNATPQVAEPWTYVPGAALNATPQVDESWES